MPTARQIITDALTVHLNRLSPGEPLSAELADVCLRALNLVVDTVNSGQMLWRESTQAATVTGASGTLGSTWAAIPYGTPILGAVVNTGNETVLSPVTFERYQAITDKASAGTPTVYAHDGGALVYFHPVPVALQITLRYGVPASDFADLDTAYAMPAGWRADLSALLAEAAAETLLGGISPAVARKASIARRRLVGRALVPSIIDAGEIRTNEAAVLLGL